MRHWKDNGLISILAISAFLGLMAAPAELAGQSKIFSDFYSQKTSGLQASIGYSPAFPKANDDVLFSASGSSNVTSWQWNFGDGTVSKSQEVRHAYSRKGYYKVILTVWAGTKSIKINKSIYVLAATAASSASPITVSFTFSPSSPSAGDTVNFTDASTGTITGRTWSFGDGGTSTERNPAHAYASAGSYAVTLVVSNGSGTNSLSKTITVKAALAGAFSYTPAAPATGETVQFTDASTGSPVSWSWNFGDGATSMLQNPTHAYASTGTYTVALSVSDSSSSKTVRKTITAVAALSGAFTYAPLSPVAGATVTFADATAGSPTAWLWNFGDGSASSLQNPTHAYASAGAYTVTLSVSDSSSTRIVNQTITVLSGISAAFTFSPNAPAAGDTILFTDASTGIPTTWQWDFGDGTTSILQNPTHAYSTAGTYTITLTAWNENGLASASDNLTVSGAGIITAASPSYDDVSAAISAARSGDLVSVPEGCATWAEQLIIRKGIRLIGAGAGKTIITCGYTPAVMYDYRCAQIAYLPADPASDEAFRLSGFTFNLEHLANWLWLGNTTINPLTKIRIDHNAVNDPKTRQILVRGTIYGVADNNVMTGGYNVVSAYGNGASSWTYLKFAFGIADTFFLEDNTIYVDDGVTESADGGRYCLRHNAMTVLNGTAGWPICDAHGNMGTGNEHSTMGVEIYDNTVNAGGYTIRLFDHRGGMGLVYGNKVTNGSADSQVREEHDDALNPPVLGPGGQPQHISGSYYWNNYYGSKLIVPNVLQTIDYGGDTGIVPRWNATCWNQATVFDGTSGVGMGTLAERPATCVKGTGYWATDQNTLYVAADTDTWTAYYTPYTYPHPLRSSLN